MFLIYLYFVLVFASSSLYLTSAFNSMGSILIAVMVILIFPLTVLFKKNNFKINSHSLLLMFLFLLACIISALLNGDFNLVTSSGMLFVLFIASFIIIPSLEIEINKVVYKAVMISHIPLIAFPLIVYGIDSNPYKGVFYNPNSYGSIVATLFAIVFALFIAKLEIYFTSSEKQQSIKNLIFYSLILFGLLFLVVISSSRTSLLTTIAIILIGIAIVFVQLIKQKRAKPMVKSIITGIVLIGGISFLIKVTSFYDYLYSNILYKFQIKSNDVLDNRGIVWSETVKNTGLFGNGSNYFSGTIVGAHNTFISILGEYGWLSLILFSLFIILGLMKSLKYAFSNVRDKYKYMPFLIVICFIFLSMGEGMIFKLSMLTMFFALGSTLKTNYNYNNDESLNQGIDIKTSRKKAKRKIVWKNKAKFYQNRKHIRE